MGDYLGMEIITTIGGIIGFILIAAFVRAPGNSLNSKFVKLGTLKGKTYSEISKVVGPSNAVSAMGNGKKLRQWQATGYHIALIFDSNDICEGVSSEIKS